VNQHGIIGECPNCGTPTTWDPLRVEPGPTCPVCAWDGDRA